MTDPTNPERSAEACPVCGEHRLALIDFPEMEGAPMVMDPAILGIHASSDPSPPGIGCLACGADWPSLAAFRAAQGSG